MQTQTITAKYANILRRGSYAEYRHALAREGFAWWFCMDIPCLVAHLQAMPEAKSRADASLRLSLLWRLVDAELDESTMADLYTCSLAAGDWEAASAAAGAGTAAVWDSGYDFQRFQPWLERIDSLLVDAPADMPLARASLLGFKANAQMNGQGDLEGAAETCHRQLLAAEEARCPSICIYHAALQTYCHLWRGSLTSAGVLLKDADYLCGEGEVMLIPQVLLRSSQGLYHTINGDPGTGRAILEDLIDQAYIEQLPPSLWLLVQSNLLFATANCDDRAALSTLAERIYRRAVPRHNAFYHSYAHFSQGVAALGLGESRQALAHAQQAIDHGVAARSAVTERMPVLLKGQALGDLGRDEEALALFEEWMPVWLETGFCTVAASAAQEAARIQLRRGKPDQARQWYARAQEAVPAGESAPLFHRAPCIAETLRAALASTVRIVEPKPVRIYCLGGFRVEIGDRVVHDRKWRGRRTKALLKALIVHGGDKVGVTQLTDLLWPDAEGDQASGNFKVALWRLRRLGVEDGQVPLPWLQLHSGHLTLAEDLCEVDVLCFEAELRHASGQTVIDRTALRQALDRYQGDFLPTDSSETWVIEHRERLCRRYLEGVLLLATSAVNPAEREASLANLQRALEVDPLDERIYQQLMLCYLEGGYPAKALEVYHAAQASLARELAIAPGTALADLAHRARGNI